jgi:hypothetical protein
MAPDRPQKADFESYFEDHEREFTERNPAPVDDGLERWVYSAPLADGLTVVIMARVTPETGDLRWDNELALFVAHEDAPDEYLDEVASMPLSDSWRDHVGTLIEKATDRVQDREHCETCDLPMLKYNDYAGEFYACVSMDCDNIVEVEPLDQQAETDA